MNTKTIRDATVAASFASLTTLLSLAPSSAIAGDEVPAGPGMETDRDIPGDSHKYYGQRWNQFRDIGRRLAKIDLDADFNYDGVVDNNDPADNGAFQQTPPGLVVGTGEMSKLVLRISPYHLDFDGKAVVSLQVDGINRGAKSGQFGSFDEEVASIGHVKVWRDASRKQLILDSRNPGKRVYEWTIDDAKYPANVPGIVPRTLYVEGISPSGAYSGDVRLLLMVQHRKPGDPVYYDPKAGMGGKAGTKGGVAAPRGKTSKRFKTSYDHILLTVRKSGHPKEFVDGNNDGVWR